MEQYIIDLFNGLWFEVCATWDNGHWERFVAWIVTGVIGSKALYEAGKRTYSLSRYTGAKLWAATKYLFLPQVPEPSHLCKILCSMVEEGEGCSWDDDALKLTCGPLTAQCYGDGTPQCYGDGTPIRVIVQNERVLEYLNRHDQDRVKYVIHERIKYMREKEKQVKIASLTRVCSDHICPPASSDDVPLIAKMHHPLVDQCCSYPPVTAECCGPQRTHNPKKKDA